VTLRLTRQQRAWQEGMLAKYGLQDEFIPHSELSEALAYEVMNARRELKTRSLFSIALERLRKKLGR
jgi:hypothetical protein